MIGLGVKAKVLLFALIPNILVIIIASIYFTHKDWEAQEEALHHRSKILAEYITQAVAARLEHTNHNDLQTFAKNTLNQSLEVRSVAIYNLQQELLAQAGPSIQHAQDNNKFQNTELDTTTYTEDYIRIKRALNATTLSAITPLPPGDSTITNYYPQQLMGWIEMEISRAPTQVKQYRMLLISSIFTFFCIFINLFFISKLAQSLIKPVVDIAQTITNIRRGRLDSRCKVKKAGELSLMAAGVNNLAASLKRAKKETQLSIEQATADLHATMEAKEIQNIELDIARKEAQESNRIKSEFLANMSHEIRTPLNGIIGFTNLVLRSKLEHQQREYVLNIHKASEDLLEIINKILDFSKIEAGKLELEQTPLSLNKLVHEVLTMLAPEAQNKHLELVPLIYNDVPKCLIGDPLRLKQVIRNLVNNAIKFTENGSIIVRCEMEDELEDDVIIKISVNDTGIGLSKAQTQELFQAFTQADTSSTRKYGGTGLGLVISKRIVEQMEGDIGLESAQGEGSTFWFRVKLKQDLSFSPQVYDHLTQKRVVLFEPHDTAKLSMTHMIHEWGIELHITDSIKELQQVLQKLQSQKVPVHATLLGLSAKDCHNISIQSLLTQLPQFGSGPIVTLINTAEEHIRTQLQKLGVPLSISKPVYNHKLYEGLCRLVLGPRQANLIQSWHNSLEQAASSSNLNIMVVDDNPANLKLLIAILNYLGSNNFAANSGKVALQLFEQHHFDLIFMDIQMPDMDGIETVKRIRQTETDTSRLTPVIMLTADSIGSHKEKIKQFSLIDYMTKPISDTQIQQAIKKWTGKTLTPLDQDEKTPAATTSDKTHNQQPITESIAEPQSNNALTAPINHSETETVVSHVFDAELALRLAGGRAELAIEMFTMLIDSLPADQENIHAAYEEGNIPLMIEHVHRLHGGTRYCGVPTLRQAAETLENLLKQNQLAHINRFVKLLDNSIYEVQEWATEENWHESIQQATLKPSCD